MPFKTDVDETYTINSGAVFITDVGIIDGLRIYHRSKEEPPKYTMGSSNPRHFECAAIGWLGSIVFSEFCGAADDDGIILPFDLEIHFDNTYGSVHARTIRQIRLAEVIGISSAPIMRLDKLALNEPIRFRAEEMSICV